jgi:hypothetical protein
MKMIKNRRINEAPVDNAETKIVRNLADIETRSLELMALERMEDCNRNITKI